MSLSKLALGRLPFFPKAKDLRLAAYLDPEYGAKIAAQEAPAALNWRKVATPAGDLPAPDTDPLGNDSIGDCVYAAPAHFAMLIGQLTGRPIQITRGQVVDAYARATGFNPATGSGDNGAYIRGTQLDAFVCVDPNDADEVALALFLGGGLIGGYDLPLASRDQVDEQGNPEWCVPPGGWPEGQGPGTWGGHAVAEHADRLLQLNTWGLNAHATTGWRTTCCGELWMPLLKGWRLGNGRAPNGFAYDDLLSDARSRGAVV
jgi:hypothetical protein